VASPDRAPYPGLRSFRREETDLFFGRDECVESMIDRLAAGRFLSVLGSSGTGKSSLVRTGLISGLEMGLVPGAGSHWWIVDFRPGSTPLHNLARRLLEIERVENSDGRSPPTDTEVNILRARLKREPGSLGEWHRTGHLPPGVNMLVLVDQFEELFRFEDYAGREEAEAFVARLLEVRVGQGSQHLNQSALPIYVTITMRSEYLGACALIEGLAEAINEGTYLAPRMTRDQCREAIEGPARVCGIKVDERLVNRLLNDLVDFAAWADTAAQNRTEARVWEDQLSRLARRADQLPLMQHALNRMWEEAKRKTEPVELTLEDYEAVGGITGAIDKHANAILDQVESGLAKERSAGINQTGAMHGRSQKPFANERRLTLTEAVFRALITGTTAADAVRRPTPLTELVHICGGDKVGVQAVINAFGGEGCNFLSASSDLVSQDAAFDNKTVIDISHESLIRHWQKLGEWVEAEATSGKIYRRLAETAALHADGKAGLWREPDLSNALAWRAQEQRDAAWAERYGDAFDLAMDFLDKSLASERQRIQSEEEAKSRRIRRRLLNMSAVLLVLLSAAATTAFLMREKARKEADAEIAVTLAAYTENDIAVLKGVLENSREESYIVGYRLFRDHQHQKAIPYFRKSIDEGRFVASSYFLLGYIASHDTEGHNDLSQAEDLLGKAIAANSDYSPAYLVRASLYSNSNRTTAALEDIRTAVLQPTKFGRAACQYVNKPGIILKDWRPLAENATLRDILQECKRAHNIETAKE
jgi:hypothetical protein